MRLRYPIVSLGLLAATVFLATDGAHAGLINGDFKSPGTSGQLTVNTSLTGWTGGGKEGLFGSQTTPPVFVFGQGTTTQLQSGVLGDAFMGVVSFYGATAAPGGGPIIAADGDPDWAGSISQNVTGLTPGSMYRLSFNWAGAQQQGFSGNTTEMWQVTFGNNMQATSLVNTPSQSFAGWQIASMDFTAASSSQLLRFLAVGAPGGLPPWLLLNGVTLTEVTPNAPPPSSVPEPTSLALLVVGVAGAALSRRFRKTLPV